MEINIREVNREWAVDIETPDKIQSIYFKSRQNALSFVKYLELADNVIELDKKELQTPMTNYDRIRAMSVEEMAECSIPFFNCPYDTPYVGCDMGKKFDDDCIKCTKAWLEQEVSE